MKISLIITAGGTSSRYGSTNKLFETVNGKRIIEYTVDAFKEIDDIFEIILPTNAEFVDDFRKCFIANSKIKIIEGGENRQQSVYNAIQACSAPDFVIIHDGARPLIEKQTIEECLKKAKGTNAAIVATKVTDTIKKVNSNLEIISTEPREILYAAQTPQIFKYSLIKSLHEKYMGRGFTDDALLCEEANLPVFVVDGPKTNLKITYKSDLLMFKNYLLNS